MNTIILTSSRGCEEEGNDSGDDLHVECLIGKLIATLYCNSWFYDTLMWPLSGIAPENLQDSYHYEGPPRTMDAWPCNRKSADSASKERTERATKILSRKLNLSQNTLAALASSTTWNTQLKPPLTTPQFIYWQILYISSCPFSPQVFPTPTYLTINTTSQQQQHQCSIPPFLYNLTIFPSISNPPGILVGVAICMCVLLKAWYLHVYAYYIKEIQDFHYY